MESVFAFLRENLLPVWWAYSVIPIKSECRWCVARRYAVYSYYKIRQFWSGGHVSRWSHPRCWEFYSIFTNFCSIFPFHPNFCWLFESTRKLYTLFVSLGVSLESVWSIPHSPWCLQLRGFTTFLNVSFSFMEHRDMGRVISCMSYTCTGRVPLWMT